MSNTIKIRRGSGVPDPSDFATYELAYDYTGNDLYVKVGSNMVKVNSEGSGTVTNVVAGNGLTGGGTTTATLDVVAGTGISVAANSVSTNDSQIVHDNLSGFVANEHIDHSGVSILAGTGLTGGGTIASSRTLNVVGENGLAASANAIGLDLSTLSAVGVNNLVDEDLFAVEIAVGGAIKKLTASSLKTYIGGGTITSVSGMTNNNVLTASGSTTISGESNLTFSSLTLQIPSASGKVSVDTLVGYSNNTNTLLFNDDQTSANNQVSLQSINHINIMTDGNNNGTGNFKVWNGSYDVDTADLAFQIGSTSNATFYGNVTIANTGDLTVPGVIKHNGDSDTYIFFTNDRIRLYAGNTLKLDTNETYLTGSVNLASEVTGTLPLTNGGTGATSAAGARLNLDLGDLATLDSISADLITSGTIADARIPSLATSKITSGTFADARIPSLAISKTTGLQTALDGKTPYDHFRNLNPTAFTAGGGSNNTLTTAQYISEMEGDGAFDSYTSAFKTSWSYAGNDNLSDAGSFGPTETAGMAHLTWTDNSSDSTRGNITVLGIAPNTGGSAGGVYVYNDQGSSYAPGWREIWTSSTDGSGSGLDADLLDGLQGSHYLNAGNLTGTLDDDRIPNLAAGKITSGTFADARIPSLAASKITSGTFGDARIPSLAASKITSGTFSSARMPASFAADSVTQDDITNRAESGFYQTASGTTGEGWPITNNTYQHMIATTHSNDSNYYSMQIAGSFYDQNFYGRKTNGSGTRSWLRFITTADEGSGNGFDADTVDGIQASGFTRAGVESGTPNTAANKTTFTCNDAINTTSGNQSGLQVWQDTAGADAFMTFHVAGDYAVYFGLDGGTNDLAVGGWSRGANSYKVWHEGNTSSFTGDLVSSQRDKGVFGTYDSTKTDHIWSMGTAYRNSSTGADFGNLYGLAYKHVNNTTGGNMGGGHQMVWATNGVPRASLGEVNIWSKGYFHAARNYGGSWDTNNDTALTFTASSSGTAYNVLRCDTDNGFKLQTLGGTGGTQRWYTSGSNYIQFTGTTITATLNGTASNAALLDNIDSSEFLRSNVADTIGAQLTMGTQTSLVASNYGHGVFGVYSASKYQHVWSMGTAYKGPADGTSTGTIGNLYGLAWSYNPDYGATGNNAQSKAGLAHQLLLANNGVTFTALGNGMWTKGHITIGTNDYALYGIDTSNQVRNLIKLDSSNRVMIGDANAAGVHHHYPSTYSQINTNNGYLQIGPQNTSHCHYTTDRANHWFNQMIYVNGGVVSSYNSNLQLRRNGDSADQIQIEASAQNFIIDATTRMRLTSSGLDVLNNIYFGTGNIWQLDQGSWTGGSSNQANLMLAGAAGTFGIHSNSSTVDLLVDGAIRSLSDVVAYYSDIRLKHKFEPITSALKKVQSLEGFTYESNELAEELGYNEDYDNLTGKRKVGVSAQQVQEVLPEAVTLAPFDTHKNEDGTIESKSGEDYLTVKYEKIVPLLIEAIKEQQQQINKLEEKLNG